MKWAGYKRVAFTSVKMDVAEIRRRSKMANVADLAANIREHGDEPIHAPTVRVPGNVLLCGRDRMAALMVLKAKKVWVRLAECSDLEAADLEASENLHRRQDDRDEVIARAVRAKEALAAESNRNKCNDRRGAASGKQAKIEARKQVARDIGISHQAVKQAEHRAAKKAAPEPEPSGQAVPVELPEPTLNLLGCDNDSTRAVCAEARPIQEAIDEADRHLRLALGALKRIEQTDVGQRLRPQVERVGSLVRSERPASLCPWCKGAPIACGGCGGKRYVSAEKAERAPREVLSVDVPVVLVDGELFSYEQVRAGRLPKKSNGAPPKRGNGIAVEDEQGRDLLAKAAEEEARELTEELTYEPDDDAAY